MSQISCSARNTKIKNKRIFASQFLEKKENLGGNALIFYLLLTIRMKNLRLINQSMPDFLTMSVYHNL